MYIGGTAQSGEKKEKQPPPRPIHLDAKLTAVPSLHCFIGLGPAASTQPLSHIVVLSLPLLNYETTFTRPLNVFAFAFSSCFL